MLYFHLIFRQHYHHAVPSPAAANIFFLISLRVSLSIGSRLSHHECFLTEEGDRRNIPSIIEYSDQRDPYVEFAHAWTSPQLHQPIITVSIKESGVVIKNLSMSIVLPERTTMPDPVSLYWKRGSTFVAEFPEPESIEATTETMTYQVSGFLCCSYSSADVKDNIITGYRLIYQEYSFHFLDMFIRDLKYSLSNLFQHFQSCKLEYRGRQ